MTHGHQTHLVVAGVDPADQRASWDQLYRNLTAYYRAREIVTVPRGAVSKMCMLGRHGLCRGASGVGGRDRCGCQCAHLGEAS